MRSAIVYSRLAALKTYYMIAWLSVCLSRRPRRDAFSDHSQTSRWTDKRKRTPDPVSQMCEPQKEMRSCHRLILASLQLCLLLLVSFTDSISLKCSPGKVCSDRPPVVLSKYIYYSTSSVLKCLVAFLYLTKVTVVYMSHDELSYGLGL